ncbi:hypothetical protein [Burkholderia ubonensis]|uniref:Lipoprotein n=1 Tax=Burkholderia ubonensis TaxID=101571 RepID=A0ABD6Q1D5_9BURK|nr:hypothetical protein [Burkholderia ubonensis]KVO12732.1 hypothetical protein WJ74_15155 [Burkholderia ubonensis]KVX96709.1 hypothetical protein WL11_26335 [Burkholderia ubonensis]KWB95491.1 hypothetical protein WL44_05145 [Burkholderia ubonensis]KWC98283.1 hypothetical protein WL59_20705 [Burkholderia ubonensis]KWD24929.1 hypothetical protein WL60_31485 [Burkholderia ubonensis]
MHKLPKRFRFGMALLGASLLVGCTPKTTVLSRLPQTSPPAIRTLTPDDQLRRADQIDRDVLSDQRQDIRREQLRRDANTQTVIIDHDE